MAIDRIPWVRAAHAVYLLPAALDDDGYAALHHAPCAICLTHYVTACASRATVTPSSPVYWLTPAELQD